MKVPRAFLALAGLTLLAACNVVITKEPLFTAADEAGAPRLKPGLWEVLREPGCKLDETLPIEQWPTCVGAGVVRPGEIIGYDRKPPNGGVFEHDPFVFAAGEPRIAQLRVKTDIAANSGAQTTMVYRYAGARATATDAQGLITALSYWFVECGPPPPKAKDGSDIAMGTLQPFPGLEMKPGDGECTTHSKAVLRGAAKASEQLRDTPQEAHWVRDGDR